MKLVVAMPCLNEEERVGKVVAAVPAAIAGIDTIVCLVVDDGSADKSAERATAAGAVVIRHGRNLGVGMAFQTAVRYALEARADLLVTIDADGQFDATDIPTLIEPLLVGRADFSTASRFATGETIPNMSALKRWGNAGMSRLVSRLSGQRFVDVSCGFRAYSREALLHLNLHGRFTYVQETFLDLSFKHLRIEEVPLGVRYFAERRSRVANNLLRYAGKTLVILVRAYRDHHPLRFFWFISATLMLPGMALIGFLGVHYLRSGHFTGHLWAGFSGGFLLIAGLILFTLGVLADVMHRQRTNQERILYYLKRQL